MAQAWQAEIHDKKSQNNSLRQKAKKYILHKNVRTQNTVFCVRTFLPLLQWF